MDGRQDGRKRDTSGRGLRLAEGREYRRDRRGEAAREMLWAHHGEEGRTWGGEALGEARKGQCVFTVIIGGMRDRRGPGGCEETWDRNFSFHFDPAR